MSVFEFNCLYAAKALFLVFVVAPLLFMLGVSLVYAVSQFLGSIWNAIILHHFPILRCRKCRYWATVQCPLYGRNTPSDFCSRRARSEIARVNALARAEGKTYGCYVALHEPRKG